MSNTTIQRVIVCSHSHLLHGPTKNRSWLCQIKLALSLVSTYSRQQVHNVLTHLQTPTIPNGDYPNPTFGFTYNSAPVGVTKRTIATTINLEEHSERVLHQASEGGQPLRANCPVHNLHAGENEETVDGGNKCDKDNHFFFTK